MATLDDFRSQFPAYKDVPDNVLADAIYEKFYKGKVDRGIFDAQIGAKPSGMPPGPFMPPADFQGEFKGGNAPQYDYKAPPPGRVESLARGANQSLTVGLADELAGVNDASGIQSPYVPGKAIIGGARLLGDYLGLGSGDATKAYEAGRYAYRKGDAAAMEAHPGYNIAGRLAGSVPAAIATAPYVGGGALAGVMGRSAVVGGGIGAAQGYGEGEGGTTERIKSALLGGTIGAGIGAIAPAAGRGISAAYGYVADKFKGVPAALQPYASGARDRVLRAFQDDAVNPATLPRLGPEAMLPDAGPNLLGQAGAIANQPGQGAKTLLDALKGRAGGAEDRIRTTMDAAMGPRRNIVDVAAQIEKEGAAAAEPIYRQFRQTAVPFTQELDDVLSVIEREPGVIKDAMRLASIDPATRNFPKQWFARENPDGSWTRMRVPNASEWDLIKKALDGRGYGGGATRNDARIYGDLSRMVRDGVDNALSPGDPASSIYARARQAGGDRIELRNALEEGQTAFSRGITPDQMAADIAKKSIPAQRMYGVGARGQVDEVMGNASTSWGANPDTAVRKMLGSENAMRKMQMVFGAPKAEQIGQRLDAETTFARTANDVLNNSKTAARQAAQGEFPAPTPTDAGQSWSNVTLTGLTSEGVRRAFNALTNGAVNEKQARIAADAAKMLTQQGTSRDRIIQALTDYGNARGATAAQKDMIDKIVRTLIVGPGREALSTDARDRLLPAPSRP